MLALAALAIAYITQKDKLHIVTGYAAKCGCTNVFVADRSADEVESTDLNYSFLRFADLDVKHAKAQVTASVFGLSAATAQYKPGFGCVLLDGKDDYQYQFPLDQPLSVTYPKKVWNEAENAQVQSVVEQYSDGQYQTRALLVARSTDLLGESYADGITSKTPLLGWSMTKSIANALIGLMVKDSLLDLQQDHLFEEWANDGRSTITLDHLLRMTSGLQWAEEYDKVGDATNMLFKAEDAVATAIDQNIAAAPGEEWLYSSGTTNLLSSLLRQTIGNDRKYWRYAEDRLFNRIQMNSAIMETDEAGNFMMSSFGYATAKDWAKFGLLYLGDGVFDGKELLPKGWVDYSRRLTDASGHEYGAHFWLNHDQQVLPDVPSDAYWAKGYQGQYCMIIPSEDLVIVRLGLDGNWPANAFVKDLLQALSY